MKSKRPFTKSCKEDNMMGKEVQQNAFGNIYCKNRMKRVRITQANQCSRKPLQTLSGPFVWLWPCAEKQPRGSACLQNQIKR